MNGVGVLLIGTHWLLASSVSEDPCGLTSYLEKVFSGNAHGFVTLHYLLR